jgi:prepilin-type N-terminal cleavage/methylation domain-containing protein
MKKQKGPMDQEIKRSSGPKPHLTSPRGTRGSTLASSRQSARAHFRVRGFTLTELMIAVVVLLVVIAAAGKIFDTVTKVTGLSEATTNVLQEATTIERQLRQDFQSLAPEGFFGIRQVRVRNDIHVAGGGELLDPSLSPNHFFRADQLVFFINSLGGIQTYRQSADGNHKGQGTTAFVYFGHGFQLPNADRVQPISGFPAAHDPAVDVFPWTQGLIDTVRTQFMTGTGIGNFTKASAGTIDATQPPPGQWLLVRQQSVLVNDDGAAANDNSKTVYLGNNIAARSIFLNDPFIAMGSAELRNGRVDAAATLMHNVRNRVEFNGATPLDWLPDQRIRIADTMQYRRAEREAPSIHRVDQALTNSVIGTGCSNVRIEWTYDPGTGFIDPDGVLNNGDELDGFSFDSEYEQPWFGLTDNLHGTGNFGDPSYQSAARFMPGDTIFPDNLEVVITDTPTLQVMETFFGYNQTRPLNAAGNAIIDNAYTPWPSAVRITLTLHDANTRLTHGREVQFVLRLPKRVGQ